MSLGMPAAVAFATAAYVVWNIAVIALYDRAARRDAKGTTYPTDGSDR